MNGEPISSTLKHSSKRQSRYDSSRLLDPFTNQGMLDGLNGVGWDNNSLPFPPTDGSGVNYAILFD